MNYTLTTTDPKRVSFVAANGKEPLRNYKQTLALIKSRLQDSAPSFVAMLAQPSFEADGSIVWNTDKFTSLPVPLDSLQGSDYEQYAGLLSASMERVKDAIQGLSPNDDARGALKAILTLPSASTIFCADGKIVIAEWGLCLANSAKGAVQLLSFSADEPQEAPPSAVVPASKSASKSACKPAEGAKEVKAVEPAAKPAEVAAPAVAAPKPPVVPEPITPQPATPPEPQPVPEPKKRSWLKWLLIVLGILLLAAVVLFLCCKCSTAEKVADLPTQLPDVNENNVVLSSDSLRYQVNDRLNIMVLSGGTLDEFIARFRKIYPDKNKYQFCSPDTAMGYVLLMVPPEEREALIEEIPQKMKPEFDVLVTPDNMHGGCYVPNDPAMQSQAESYYFAEVNAPEAWDVEKGKADVVVAVLDDGFDVAHPELQGKVVKPYDAVREASTVRPSGDGHGQHTAGTAVGRSDNGQGACGIAPGCSLMPVNVFYNNGASDSAVIKGLIYAVNNGAKVINLSLGPSFYGCKFMPIEQQQIVAQSSFLQEAQMWDKLYEKIENAGVTVTKAAGNDTVLAAMDPMNRSQHIIVVSAVDSAGDMAIFDFMQGSNYGDACDISAPGVNIYNSVPGNRYEAMSGTSMAAPQVAGGAALLYSHFPGITPKQVKEILVGTAVPTDEYVGPLMDLQAALAADPSDPSTYANPRQEASDPVRGRQPSTQADPYYDYYLVIINNPDREADELFDNPDTDTNPRYNPAPGSGSGNSCGDYDAALAEYKRIMQQLQDLRRRYPGCFS